LHDYYTPKPIEFQGFLAILAFFVNYADFYVNIIMSTDATSRLPCHRYLEPICHILGHVYEQQHQMLTLQEYLHISFDG
jgi:hypothetical protein